ncbi:hypothetical protein BN1723_020115, partial [Verticillium longisporum]
ARRAVPVRQRADDAAGGRPGG